MKAFFRQLVARWRLWWNLCPMCNSDAPRIDVCPVCHGHREVPLSELTKDIYFSRWWTLTRGGTDPWLWLPILDSSAQCPQRNMHHPINTHDTITLLPDGAYSCSVCGCVFTWEDEFHWRIVK